MEKSYGRSSRKTTSLFPETLSSNTTSASLRLSLLRMTYMPKGFEIRTEAMEPVPVLTVSEMVPVEPVRAVADDFRADRTADERGGGNQRIVFDLSFQYGDFTFRFDSFGAIGQCESGKEKRRLYFSQNSPGSASGAE